MSDDAARLEIFIRFSEQCDDTEKVMLLNALDRLAKAKSKSAQTRCLNDFGDWYLKRRGLEPRTPKRGAGRGAKKL